jgi:hypothetical protein
MRTSFMTRIAVAAILATLGIAGVASAKAGDRTFEQTYPVASGLCAKAVAGTLPKRLEPQAAQVTTACNTLQSAFGPLQTTVKNAEAQYAAGLAAVKASIQSACVTKGPACRTARIQGRAQKRNLRVLRHLAVRTYYVNIEANRRTFWATIHALRGGRSIKADPSIPVQSS